jgi:hypothetical protein
MSANLAIGLTLAGVLAIRVGVRLFGRYLARNFGRGAHPRLEGDGDRRLSRLAPSRERAIPPQQQDRPRAREPQRDAGSSAFGPTESGSPFGED